MTFPPLLANDNHSPEPGHRRCISAVSLLRFTPNLPDGVQVKNESQVTATATLLIASALLWKRKPQR